MDTKFTFRSHLKDRSLKLKAKRGFALIELLIAVVLFGIISTFVILAYNRVSGQLFLSTLAYELALSFRQAQSYGVSVHQFQGDFDVGYGLHFDSDSQAKTTYAMFADEGEIDGIFNGGFGSAYDASGCLANNVECISVFKLEKGNTIYKFCGVLPTGDGGRDVADTDKNEECNIASTPPDGGNPNIAFLDVTFLRPNPDAIIRTNRSADGQLYTSARVYVQSPTGEKRVVEVVSTGQISIK
ncbi:MAG: hypothetical protein UY50_C0026G0016 [Parcubacteria group bacterium GW2011_GWA2_49_9]|nr:MAG: hypothetical protein UY50_C0026G0016 [Parcubacteria group bacterium GW2011_GWA2_49_9]